MADPHEKVTHPSLYSHSVQKIALVGFLVVEGILDQVHTESEVNVRSQFVGPFLVGFRMIKTHKNAHICQPNIIVFNQNFILALLQIISI